MNKEHKYKDKHEYKDKDKDVERMTESLTVCYIFGILTTQLNSTLFLWYWIHCEMQIQRQRQRQRCRENNWITNSVLYFWNPDDSSIPRMMVDTSPWSAASAPSAPSSFLYRHKSPLLTQYHLLLTQYHQVPTTTTPYWHSTTKYQPVPASTDP